MEQCGEAGSRYVASAAAIPGILEDMIPCRRQDLPVYRHRQGAPARKNTNYGMNKKSLVFVVYILAVAALLYFQFKSAHDKRKLAPPAPAAQLMAEAKSFEATGQYQRAMTRYAQVENTYKGTPDAGEAIYQQALLLQTRLHITGNEYAAYQKLTELTNPSVLAAFGLAPDYRKISYPSKPYVDADKARVEATIDYFYAHSNRSMWYALDIPYKDLYAVMNWCVNLTGAKSYSYWIALLLISVVVRLVLTPLTIKQYKSMREMKRLQPLLKELQTKYKDDKQLLTQRTMDLYKEHNVNPAAGCVPLLIQMPIFSAMYWAVRVYQFHFTGGTFLWIGSGMAHRFPEFLAPNLSQQDIPLLLLYSASMYVTQRMMPATDPSQAEMQKTSALMMSVFFFIMFVNYNFPSAFVLYWFISNVLSTGTQLYFMRQGDATPPGATPTFPSDGEVGNGKNGKNGTNGSGALSPNGSTKRLSAPDGEKEPAQGTAKGVIAPKKIHPKKKKR